MNAVASLYHHFGFFVFQISDPDTYNIYRPFINNLANYVALSLESRQQRDSLQRAHDELEHKVEERTQDLAVANTHLREEIETRRQAEEALRASEGQIKQLIENIPDLVARYDADLRRIYVNPAWERANGLSAGEILPMWLLTTFPKFPTP